MKTTAPQKFSLPRKVVLLVLLALTFSFASVSQIGINGGTAIYEVIYKK